jgi:hypothetical protein
VRKKTDGRNIDLAWNFIQTLGVKQKIKIFSSPGVVSYLGNSGKNNEIMAFVQTLTPAQQTQILSAPNAAYGVGHMFLGDELLGVIMKLNPEQQVQVLTAPGAFWGIFGKADSSATKRRWNYIDRLKPEQLVKIFSIPEVVECLCLKYLDKDVLECVAKFTAQQQIQILSDPKVMKQFTKDRRMHGAQAQGLLKEARQKVTASRVPAVAGHAIRQRKTRCAAR